MPTHHYTESGLDHVWLRGGVETRAFGAYGPAVAVTDEAGLWRVLGRAIARQERRMTGQELRFLRGLLDWTQTELGRRLGYADHQRVARWEKDRAAPVPLHADLFARACYLESLGEPPMLRATSARLAAPVAMPAAVPRRMVLERSARGWRQATAAVPEPVRARDRRRVRPVAVVGTDSAESADIAVLTDADVR